MATTIDTIQVEIQSSSANAAGGIRDLASAMAELKKNGTISVTAVNNLKSLSQALKDFTSVSSNANKIKSLATALSDLKSVGSVSSIGTGLAKLRESLKGLDTINVETIAPQIQKIADAVSPLSAVKAGGLSTMVNALSKISKVTNELNDDAINAFADRVGKLTEKLTPLSDKMTTVQAGLKSINSSARSAGNGVKEMGDEVDGATVNFAGFIYIVQEAVQWLQAAIQKFSEITQEAIEWDGIAARFGRGFGAQAQETYEWIQRLNEEMGINIQQFMQYSSVYATMLTGFGVAHKDATKMALGYTELTYDIWAGYNDIYKNFADAAEAVKSAIAGEVEPIRRAGFTIVEATLEQTAANHGLEISLEKATEAQKSYLRYLTLVDQAHAQGLVGTYAKELNTAEGLTRTLAQQLKSLTQAFGSLFLPILVRVLPWIQAFVELLTDAIRTLASFLGITLQEVDWSNYSAGIGSAVENTDNLSNTASDATKAMKELKNATLGIDELNVISPPSSSSTGGAAGGAGGNGFAGLDVDSLWDETIFDSIQSDVDEIKKKLEDWLPLIATVAGALAALRLAKLITDIGEVTRKLKAMLGITAATGAAGGAAAGFLASIKEFFAAAKQMAPEVGWFAALFPKLSTFLAGLPGMLSTAAAALSAAAPYLAIAAAVVGGITLALVDYDFTEIGYTIGKKVGEAVRWAFDNLTPLGLAIKFGKWLMAELDVDTLWGLVKTLFNVKTWTDKIFPAIENVFKSVSEWINGKIENLRGNINEFFGGFFDGLFDGLGVDVSWAKKFAKIFDIKYLDIVDSIMKPSSIGKKIIEKIVGAMNTDSVKNRLSTAWSKAKTWWDNKKTALKSYTPSIGSIYDKLSARWGNARDWWNKKKGSLSYTPSIGSITDKVKSAWNSAKKWWNNNVKLSTKLDIKVPKIEVKWDTVSAFGKSFKYPTGFNLKFAADGGIFNQGSLVWAGERGPEIVANAAGGKTGVMNIQQMRDAVYEGVYSAVVAGMRMSGDGGDRVVQVVLPDGRVLASTVEKAQRERGANIMGNQVYGYG